jgi:prevent-host-death family protein
VLRPWLAVAPMADAYRADPRDQECCGAWGRRRRAAVVSLTLRHALCHNETNVAQAQRGPIMRTVTIRQLRAALPGLDRLVAKEGEVLVTRRGRPLARLLPVRSVRLMPSNAALRASMRRLSVPSEVLIRQDRDGR